MPNGPNAQPDSFPREVTRFANKVSQILNVVEAVRRFLYTNVLPLHQA